MITFRIAILGPECSGKTTLANQLSKKLDADFVEEYAREYLKELDRPYEMFDLNNIAKEQARLNKQSTDKPYFIADTELLTIKIWSMVRFKQVSDTVSELLKEQDFDLYLLCKPDIPWEADPMREHPTERMDLFSIYESELEFRNAHFRVIEGENRLEKAINYITGIS